jgi:hypothetical protein
MCPDPVTGIEFCVPEPCATEAPVESGIAVAIAPVPLAVGRAEVNRFQVPVEDRVTRIRTPISVRSLGIAADEITVVSRAPLTTYSNLISSPPVLSPTAMRYPSTVAEVSVGSFA